MRINSIAGWHNADPVEAPRMRVMVVTLVTVLHIAAYAILLLQPPRASVPLPDREIAVTLLAPDVVGENAPSPLPVKIMPPQPQVEVPQPTPLLLEQQHDATTAPTFVPTDNAMPVVAAATGSKPEENAATEIEPDYQASYLNNRLTYPLAARRMGIQGRVILNVEVLAEGIVGQINIQHSSGHEVLDQAALESVRHWRFIAARHGGVAFTRWFTVPIQFSLQGNTP